MVGVVSNTAGYWRMDDVVRRSTCPTLRAMATTCRSYLPEQDLLLPPSVRDWLPEDHPAHFVSDLVDQLALSAITLVYEDGRRDYPRITR